MLAFCRRFGTVPGERMFAKTRWSSSQTAVVPFGERFGVPSEHTVATKPSLCSSMTRFMSAVRSPMTRPPRRDARTRRVPAGSVSQLRDPPLQERALGGGAGADEGGAVRVAGVGVAAGAAQEVGAGGEIRAVVGQ